MGINTFADVTGQYIALRLQVTISSNLLDGTQKLIGFQRCLVKVGTVDGRGIGCFHVLRGVLGQGSIDMMVMQAFIGERYGTFFRLRFQIRHCIQEIDDMDTGSIGQIEFSLYIGRNEDNGLADIMPRLTHHTTLHRKGLYLVIKLAILVIKFTHFTEQGNFLVDAVFDVIVEHLELLHNFFF